MDLHQFLPLNYAWERKLFNTYFRFALRGRMECTIWECLIEYYHFRCLETIFMAGLNAVVMLVLLVNMLITDSFCAIETNIAIFMFFNAVIVKDMLLVKKTREDIFAYWDELAL
ncbi:MAG: hypothetical protein HQM09_17465 [Candidatus Riflebacteria bacterium]|nr:hypothetical protein [Candidatus Riflebacteria bacterium]